MPFRKCGARWRDRRLADPAVQLADAAADAIEGLGERPAGEIEPRHADVGFVRPLGAAEGARLECEQELVIGHGRPPRNAEGHGSRARVRVALASEDSGSRLTNLDTDLSVPDLADHPRRDAVVGQLVDDAVGEARAQITTKPTPMLKTRNISASATLPSFCSHANTGGTGHEPRFT